RTAEAQGRPLSVRCDDLRRAVATVDRALAGAADAAGRHLSVVHDQPAFRAPAEDRRPASATDRAPDLRFAPDLSAQRPSAYQPAGALYRGSEEFARLFLCD